MNHPELSNRFEEAVIKVKNLEQRPDNDTLLILYALYKQATIGNNTGARPGFTDFAGRLKYDAWSKLKGTTQEAAMEKYINLVNLLINNHQ